MTVEHSTRPDAYLNALCEATESWIRQGAVVVPTGGYPPDLATNQTMEKGWPDHPLRSAADFWQRASEPGGMEIRGIAAVHGRGYGSVAFDMDGVEGRRHFRWLEAHGLIRPDDLIIDTPNGVHLITLRDDDALRTRFQAAPECSGCVLMGGGFAGPEGDGRLHVTSRGQSGPQTTKLPPTRRPLTGATYVSRHGGTVWDPLPQPAWMIGRPLPKPRPFAVVPDPAVSGEYGRAAFRGELAEVLRTEPGGRNRQLNQSAFRLGTLVVVGVLDAETAARGLFRAAETIGLVADDGQRQVLATIKSGLRAGFTHPREVTT